MTTRKTLKDFLSNSSTNKPSDDGDSILRYKMKRVNEDGLHQYDGDDLQDAVKETIGSYVRFIVKEADNIYGPLNSDSEKIEDISIYRRGDTLKGDSNSYDMYISNADPNLKRSSSDYLDTSEYLDKTGADASKTGHEVLSNVNNDATGINKNSNPTPNNLKEYSEDSLVYSTQEMLINNNRFANHQNSSINNFTGDQDLSIEDFESNENINEGSFVYPTVFGESSKENKIKLEKLKKIGESLLYKASGHDGVSLFSGGKKSNDPENITNEMDNNLFSGVRYTDSGISNISKDTYRARYSGGDFFNTLSESISDDKGNLAEQNTESVGQTYNTNYNFFGKNLRMQKIQVILALKAVLSLYEEKYREIIEGLEGDENQENNLKEKIASEGRPYKIGTADKSFSLRLQYVSENILVRTSFPYKNCVERGLFVCFGDVKNKNINDVKTAGSAGIKGSGFWLAVASSVLKRASNDFNALLLAEETKISSELSDYWEVKLKNAQSDPVLKFFNAMATIGDISFKAFSGKSLSTHPNQRNNFRDVDQLPDTPGNRVGKSRKRKGKRLKQLAWAQNEVPSAYLLPLNVIQAAAKLDRGPGSVNPLRGIIGSDLVENVYMGLDTDGSGNRIPAEAVKAIEDRLDAEYVPLYIQDLRTNEIIGFNAFIQQLNDTFNTSYAKSGGYGRLDAVHVFENTTRSIKCDFHLVATSREDFNTMWYKINKFITLIYPQWTQGTRVADQSGNIFIQPHSQVIGATPVVRLRVGDVVKSNYSKFNFARIFGIGDKGIRAKRLSQSHEDKINKISEFTPPDVVSTFQKVEENAIDTFQENIIRTIVALYGSPLQYKSIALDNISKDIPNSVLKAGGGGAGFLANQGAEILTEYLKNGFVSPIASLTTLYQLQDPATRNIWGGFFDDMLTDTYDVTNIIQNAVGNIASGYVPFTTTLLLKPNMVNGYQRTNGAGRVYNQKPIRVMVTDIFDRGVDAIDFNKNITEKKVIDRTEKRTRYKVKIVDGTLLADLVDGEDELFVYHEDLNPIPSAIFFNTGIASILSGIASFPASTAGVVKDAMGEGLNNLGLGSAVGNTIDAMFASAETRFMAAENNPFVRAYESTRGRGLAGVINGINFSWYDNESVWETDFNARGPTKCKISFNLDVIHDIPPGLDHTGFNRAPLYNVGDIMREMSGDVYDDGGKAAEFRHKKGTTLRVDYNNED